MKNQQASLCFVMLCYEYLSVEDCEAKCTDNAECIQGQCVYKENSTVDGMRCERPKGKWE